MTTVLTAEQLLTLAPDPASARAAQGLRDPHRWSGLGHSERALWGECRGSGASPYRVQVDLQDFASRCSCPSRKFPCKHALGLLLLHAAEPAPPATEPAGVRDWLNGRRERAGKTTPDRAPEAEGPGDKAAEGRAKRTEARDRRVRDGLAELEGWLEDLVRAGLATAVNHPPDFWETMAARLVDAQAPGAARLVRRLAGVPLSGEGWPARLLGQLSLLHLLARGYAREDLPPDLRAQLRGVLGWSPDTAEVLSGAGVPGEWGVLGHTLEQEDRLTVRRTWLRREDGREALVLAYAHAAAPLPPPLPTGTRLQAELCYYPGTLPLRAAVKEPLELGRLRAPFGEASVRASLTRFARALARNPWLERYPLTLAEVWPRPDGEGWLVRDAAGDSLPLAAGFQRGWDLLALSGGHPLSLAGEWDGRELRPLGAGTRAGWFSLREAMVSA